MFQNSVIIVALRFFGNCCAAKLRNSSSDWLEPMVGPTSQPVGPATFIVVLLSISSLPQCRAANTVQLIQLCQANRD